MYKQDTFKVTALSKEQCDITNLYQVRELIGDSEFDCIINAAAYTNVDQAEDNYELSKLVNCESVKNISQCIEKSQTLLIHFSTDYVFDGESKRPYRETDRANPVNAYGKSKYEGENIISSSNINYLLFRTSWVYNNTGNNFPNKILASLHAKKSMHVVDDQVGVPNYADQIAETTYACLEKYFSYSDDMKKNTHGIYHMSSIGSVSWYNFAEYILDKYCATSLDESKYEIKPIKTSSFECKAKRPLFSVLDSSKLSSTFDIDLPSWQDGANQFVKSKL